jgi:hypothetical protein
MAEHQSSQLPVSDSDWELLSSLAQDLDAVWEGKQCDERLKKRIVRLLINEVLVDLDEQRGEIKLTIHWQGGVHTELVVPRKKRGSSTRTDTNIIEAVRQLVLISNDEQIAGVLNRNGHLTGRGNRFTRERVVSLRCSHDISVHNAQERIQNGWMTLTEAADHMGISPRTLRLAAEAGEIDGKHPLADGPWVFNKAELETDTARAVQRRVKKRNRVAVPNPKQQTLDFSGT